MKRNGFTLAEVLITLTIIGVIAMLTVPNLMRNYQKHVWVTQLRKAHSRIATINTMILREGISKNNNGYYSPEQYQNIQEIISQTGAALYQGTGSYGLNHYNYSLNGKYGTLQLRQYKKLNGDWYSTTDPKCQGRLVYAYSDGMLICFQFTYLTSATYWDFHGANYTFLVDLNGSKDPNQIGRDIFFFGPGAPFKLNDTSDCAHDKAGFSCAAKIMKDGWKMNY